MKKPFAAGMMILIITGLVITGFFLFKRATSIIVSPGAEVVNTRFELIVIVGMLEFSHETDRLSLVPEQFGTNLNINGFGRHLLDRSEFLLTHNWIPMALILNECGDWVDPRGEPIQVVLFGIQGKSANEETALLARRYRAAAWAVGRNGVNEFGGGDDIFIGRRWNNEWESVRYVSPWWKFWER